MPNRRYEKGVRLERRIKAYMEARGYTVIRASGSHGKADLICLPDKEKSYFELAHTPIVFLIQAKAGKLGERQRNRYQAAMMSMQGYRYVKVLVLGSDFRKTMA